MYHSKTGTQLCSVLMVRNASRTLLLVLYVYLYM